MSSLSTCHKTIYQVNSLLYKFFGDGKDDKVKRSTCSMINDNKEGGLKMIDIVNFNKAHTRQR